MEAEGAPGNDPQPAQETLEAVSSQPPSKPSVQIDMKAGQTSAYPGTDRPSAPQGQTKEDVLLEKLRLEVAELGGSLEEGWHVKIKDRKSGGSAGTRDTYYVNPKGRSFPSRSQVFKFLGLELPPEFQARAARGRGRKHEHGTVQPGQDVMATEKKDKEPGLLGPHPGGKEALDVGTSITWAATHVPEEGPDEMASQGAGLRAGRGSRGASPGPGMGRGRGRKMSPGSTLHTAANISHMEAYRGAQERAQGLRFRFPLTSNVAGVVVEDLGRVDMRPGYVSETHIWPVGYRATCQYPLLGKFISEIRDTDGRPEFTVSLAAGHSMMGGTETLPGSSLPYNVCLLATSGDPDSAWQAVAQLQKQCKKPPQQQELADRQGDSNNSPEGLPLSVHELLQAGPPIPGRWGMALFGLADPTVLTVLEALPGVDQCDQYVFVEQRPGGWQHLTQRLQKEVDELCKNINSSMKRKTGLGSGRHGKRKAEDGMDEQLRIAEDHEDGQQDVVDLTEKDDLAGVTTTHKALKQTTLVPQMFNVVSVPWVPMGPPDRAPRNVPLTVAHPPGGQSEEVVIPSGRARGRPVDTARREEQEVDVIQKVLGRVVNRVSELAAAELTRSERERAREEVKAARQEEKEARKQQARMKLEAQKLVKKELQEERRGHKRTAAVPAEETGRKAVKVPLCSGPVDDMDLPGARSQPLPSLTPVGGRLERYLSSGRCQLRWKGTPQQPGLTTSASVADLISVWTFLNRFEEVLELPESCQPLTVHDLEEALLRERKEGDACQADGQEGLLEALQVTVVKLLVDDVFDAIFDYLSTTGVIRHREYPNSSPPVNSRTWPEAARRYLAAVATAMYLGQSEPKSLALHSADLPGQLSYLEWQDWLQYMFAGGVVKGMSRVALLPQNSGKNAADSLLALEDAKAVEAAWKSLLIMGGRMAGSKGPAEGGPEGVAHQLGANDQAAEIMRTTGGMECQKASSSSVLGLLPGSPPAPTDFIQKACSQDDVVACRELLVSLVGLCEGHLKTDEWCFFGSFFAGALDLPVGKDFRVISARLEKGIYQASGDCIEAILWDIKEACSLFQCTMKKLSYKSLTLPGYNEAAGAEVLGKAESLLVQWVKDRQKLKKSRDEAREKSGRTEDGQGNPNLSGTSSKAVPLGDGAVDGVGSEGITSGAQAGASTADGEQDGRKADQDIDTAAVVDDLHGAKDLHRPLQPASAGCRVCWGDHDLPRLMICDGCDDEYHCYCLEPPLLEVPEGDWYCQNCWSAQQHRRDSALKALGGYWGSMDSVQESGKNVGHSRADDSLLDKVDRVMSGGRAGQIVFRQLMELAHLLDVREYGLWDPAQKLSLLSCLCDLALDTRVAREFLSDNFEKFKEKRKELTALRAKVKRGEKGAGTATGTEKVGKEPAPGVEGTPPPPASGAPGAPVMDPKQQMMHLMGLEEELESLEMRARSLGCDRYGNRYWLIRERLGPFREKTHHESSVYQETVSGQMGDGGELDGPCWAKCLFGPQMAGLLDYLNPQGTREGPLRAALVKLQEEHLRHLQDKGEQKQEAVLAGFAGEPLDGIKANDKMITGEADDLVVGAAEVRTCALDMDLDEQQEVSGGTGAEALQGDNAREEPGHQGTETGGRSTPSLPVEATELRGQLQNILQRLPDDAFHPFWGSDDHQALWVQAVETARKPAEFVACLVVLHSMLVPECFRAQWRWWTTPWRSCVDVHTWAGVFYLVDGFQGALKKGFPLRDIRTKYRIPGVLYGFHDMGVTTATVGGRPRRGKAGPRQEPEVHVSMDEEEEEEEEEEKAGHRQVPGGRKRPLQTEEEDMNEPGQEPPGRRSGRRVRPAIGDDGDEINDSGDEGKVQKRGGTTKARASAKNAAGGARDGDDSSSGDSDVVLHERAERLRLRQRASGARHTDATGGKQQAVPEEGAVGIDTVGLTRGQKKALLAAIRCGGNEGAVGSTRQSTLRPRARVAMREMSSSDEEQGQRPPPRRSSRFGGRAAAGRQVSHHGSDEDSAEATSDDETSGSEESGESVDERESEREGEEEGPGQEGSESGEGNIKGEVGSSDESQEVVPGGRDKKASKGGRRKAVISSDGEDDEAPLPVGQDRDALTGFPGATGAQHEGSWHRAEAKGLGELPANEAKGVQQPPLTASEDACGPSDEEELFRASRHRARGPKAGGAKAARSDVVACVPNGETDRLKRVLNAKQRLIGVDREALDNQVIERKKREEEEAERDRAYAILHAYHGDLLSLQHQDADKTRREWAKELDDFRLTQQLKPSTREWDLNRPEYLKEDLPARVGDDDPRCGTSSLQRFAGEDLTAADRCRAQEGQCRTWWQQQQVEKGENMAQEQQIEEAWADLMRYQDAVQQEAKQQETATRKALERMTLEVNRKLAQDRKAHRETVEAKELAQKLQELESSWHSPWLTEDPNQAASCLSQCRVRRDHWKGMTETERQAILRTQMEQIQEHRRRLQQQKEEEDHYVKMQKDVLTSLHEQLLGVDKFKQKQARQAADFLQQQAEEKRQRDKELKELYSNAIAPEFFQQFGTSHR